MAQACKVTTADVESALKRTAQSSICVVLEDLERQAKDAGLYVTARALNNAKNAAGWEAAGEVVAAGAAARGDRPTESRTRGR